MNNIQHIRTYDELVKEEQRLSILVQWHRTQIKDDVEDVKRQLAPVARVASFIAHPVSLLRQNSWSGMGLGMGAGMLALNIAKKIGGSLLQRLIGRKKSR